MLAKEAELATKSEVDRVELALLKHIVEEPIHWWQLSEPPCLCCCSQRPLSSSDAFFADLPRRCSRCSSSRPGSRTWKMIVEIYLGDTKVYYMETYYCQQRFLIWKMKLALLLPPLNTCSHLLAICCFLETRSSVGKMSIFWSFSSCLYFVLLSNIEQLCSFFHRTTWALMCFCGQPPLCE